jgi:hypothetical protein
MRVVRLFTRKKNDADKTQLQKVNTGFHDAINIYKYGNFYSKYFVGEIVMFDQSYSGLVEIVQ